MSARSRKEKELELLELEQEQLKLLALKNKDPYADKKKAAQEAFEKKDTENMQYLKELAVDIPVKAAQGATLGFSDEIMGGLGALATDQTYEEARDYHRGLQKRADERSPVASTLAELGGGALLGMGAASKIGSGLAPIVAESALAGAGYTEREDPAGVAKDMGKAAMLGGGLHGVSKLLKIPFSRPDDIRAHYTGKGVTDFKKIERFGDPVDMAAGLNELNFYKYKHSSYDPKKHVFVNRGKGLNTPPTVEDSLRNAERGLKEIRKRKNRILQKAGKVPSSVRLQILDNIDKSLNFMIEKSHNQKRTADVAVKEFLPILDELQKDMSYKELEVLKQNWQDASSKFFNKIGDIDPNLVDNEKAVASVASAIKNSMDEALPVDYVKLNESSRFLHMAKKGLVDERAIARGRDPISAGDSYISPVASIPYYGSKIANIAGGGQRGKLIRADIGEFIDAPKTARSRAGMTETVVEDGEIFTREFPDASLPSRAFEGLGHGLKVQPSQFFTDDIGREPQSIPEQLVRYKIPRTTQGVLDNADAIKMKVAQQAPQLYDQFVELIDNNPEKIGDLLPVLDSVAPHLLEDDKYGRIDGRIFDPAKKEMAREDVMRNDDLSNSQKILTIDRLNKTGEFDL